MSRLRAIKKGHADIECEALLDQANEWRAMAAKSHAEDRQRRFDRAGLFTHYAEATSALLPLILILATMVVYITYNASFVGDTAIKCLTCALCFSIGCNAAVSCMSRAA